MGPQIPRINQLRLQLKVPHGHKVPDELHMPGPHSAYLGFVLQGEDMNSWNLSKPEDHFETVYGEMGE